MNDIFPYPISYIICFPMIKIIKFAEKKLFVCVCLLSMQSVHLLWAIEIENIYCPVTLERDL